MALVPGMRLGAYEVTALLGAGGMGEVYRARDSKLKRDVALKVLPTDVASTPERLARFRREAELLASLSHPNIAHVYGLEESGGITALIMELVEGVDLSARIAGGAIPIHEALPIAKQIAGALEAAHEQGIIHRDLKPGNIRVRPDGTVKVLDFGLAKAFDVATAPSHPSNALTATAPATAAGVILGTAAYMSPEQARGRPVDKRTDIWAFGCVLSEMLIGRRAFEGDDVTDVLARILEREPDFSALPPLTPPAIRRLLRRCLEKDRSQRLPDIGVARLEIDEAMTALATAPVLPAPSPSHRPAHWRERAAWLLAGVAIVGASVLALLTLRGSVSAPQPTVRFDVNTPPTPDAFSFALSPDGRHLAFVATADGRPHIFVRALDQVTAQPLAGTEGASYPFWSPDSRSVGFFANGKLRRKDLDGEQPQTLADAPAGRGGTWNADGVIVFAPAPVVGLMRVAATGGNPVAVTELSGDQGSHRLPQFLPDGRRFLFFVGLGQASARGVYLGSLDGGEPTRVLAGETTAWYAPPGYLLRVLKGALVAHRFDVERATAASESVVLAQAVGVDDGTFRSAFSVSDGGVLAYRPGTGTRRQLVWLNRAGKTLGVLGPVDDAAPSTPELSPDGRRVALSRAPEGTSDIWLIDLARDVSSRLTFDPGVDGYPVWSPDGDRLVFGSGRDGRIDLFEKSPNGTGDERPLLVTGQDKVAQDWSPNGQTLLFTAQDPKTGTDLWALPIDDTPGAPKAANSARQPFPVVQSAYDEGQAEFSPNGRWVAFVSNETGRQEVSILSFPDLSSKSRVSTGGGIFPRWRPDGRELYYLAPDMRLMAATIEPDAALASASPRAPEALFSTRLSTTGAYVFTAGIFARPQYAVASDGRFLMSVNDDAAALPITVVLNWTAGLVNSR